MDPTKDSEKFCLKWNEYESNVSATFKELRDDHDFADVTLASDEGGLQMEVHKIVLAASSPFFSTLLRKNKNEDRHPMIFLKGVKPKELKSVVDFMYNGEVNVFQEDLKEFLIMAEELQLRGLRQDGENSKEQSCSESNDNEKVTYDESGNDGDNEIIINPEDNKDIDEDMDDIAEIDESFSENGNDRVMVEESDNIEEMIEAMMVRVGAEWTCAICGKKAGKYKNNLRKHVEIVHVDQKGKPCKFCGKAYKSRPNLYAHLRRCQQAHQFQSNPDDHTNLAFVPHEETEGDNSYGQMVAMDSLELDVSIDPEVEAKIESLMTRVEGDWVCGACGKSSGNLKSNLRKHVEAIHMDNLILPCHNCGRTFGSRNALQCHQCHRSVPHLSTAAYVIKPETSGTGHLCEICNKEFKTKQSLKVHTQAIHEGIKYNCEFCPHSATTQSNLKVHVQKKHSMQALAPMQPYM